MERTNWSSRGSRNSGRFVGSRNLDAHAVGRKNGCVKYLVAGDGEVRWTDSYLHTMNTDTIEGGSRGKRLTNISEVPFYLVFAMICDGYSTIFYYKSIFYNLFATFKGEIVCSN